jgi:hypothetical protein
MATVRGLILAALTLGAVGCGPIEYITIITFQASREVAGAKSAKAEQLAPYEYTAAVEYLHKARELGGYARFQQSVEFGRKARELGKMAFDMARTRKAVPGEAKP